MRYATASSVLQPMSTSAPAFRARLLLSTMQSNAGGPMTEQRKLWTWVVLPTSSFVVSLASRVQRPPCSHGEQDNYRREAVLGPWYSCAPGAMSW